MSTLSRRHFFVGAGLTLFLAGCQTTSGSGPKAGTHVLSPRDPNQPITFKTQEEYDKYILDTLQINGITPERLASNNLRQDGLSLTARTSSSSIKHFAQYRDALDQYGFNRSEAGLRFPNGNNIFESNEEMGTALIDLAKENRHLLEMIGVNLEGSDFENYGSIQKGSLYIGPNKEIHVDEKIGDRWYKNEALLRLALILPHCEQLKIPMKNAQGQWICPPAQIVAPDAEFDIVFDHDKDVLTPHAKAELDQFVQEARAIPDGRIVFSAHTDTSGTNPYNDDLSDRRAGEVLRYLVSKGIPQERVQAIKTCGENVPANDLGDGVRAEENRRVIGGIYDAHDFNVKFGELDPCKVEIEPQRVLAF